MPEQFRLKTYISVNRYPPLYGTGRYQMLAGMLSTSGLDVEVLAPDYLVSRIRGKLSIDPDIEDRMPVIYPRKIISLKPFSETNNTLGLTYGLTLKHILKNSLKKNSGIVIGFYPCFSTLFGSFEAAFNCNCPFFAFLENNPFMPFGGKNISSKKRLKLLNLLNNSNAVIVSSGSLKKELLSYNVKSPIEIITNGHLKPLEDIGQNPAPERFEIICLNADSEFMNLAPLCKAMQMLKEYHPQTTEKVLLTIYGERKPKLMKKLEPYLEEDFIEFGGFITDEAEDVIIKKSHLAVVPLVDNYDTCVIPEVVYRYIADGVPYVICAADGSETRRFTEKYQVGLTVPPNNPAAISGTIVNMVAEPGYYTQLQENQTKVRSHLLYEGQKNELFEILLKYSAR